MPKSIWWLLLLIILIGGIFLFTYQTPGSTLSQPSSSSLPSKEIQKKPPDTHISTPKTQDLVPQRGTFGSVGRVIDGDTVELTTGERVRYIGINTPETVDPRKPVEAFGKEAKDFNQQLVLGKEIRLEQDIQDKDKYGRLLRYVFLPDGTFVNKQLVEAGFAYASSYPPNIKYDLELREAQARVQKENRGLWGSTSMSVSTPTCTIKGNINDEGEKIYHLPGMAFYEKTVIDEGKGERWFCTEEEAQSAGWRKSKR